MESIYKKSLYSKGFVQQFLVLPDVAIIKYKGTDFYATEYEKGVRWNNPDINIKLPLDEIILS